MSNWVRGLRHRFRLIGILGGAALALSPAAAHAQSFNITNLTSNTASKATFPTMAVDASGNLNVAWIDSVKGIMFSRFSSTNLPPNPPPTQMIVGNGVGQTSLPAFQPQMIVDPTANIIEIVWAAPDATATGMYDVFASRSTNGGVSFTSLSNPIVASPGVALFDSPRLAFDGAGGVVFVWGKSETWFQHSPDGTTFPSAPTNLATAPQDTGGPRVAVDANGNIYVAWTDELAEDQAKPGDGNYCTDTTTDPSGNITNTFGGNLYINVTPKGGSPGVTKNLSNTDWKGSNSKFPQGFFGCSKDSLNLFVDASGSVHLIWSDDQPVKDVLSSRTIQINGATLFSFPINLANLPAASPQAVTDKNGSIYVVWSGGPTGGTSGVRNSQGTFFSRSDDGASTFTTAVNIASPSATAPAYPGLAVDSNSNVNVAWEQVDQPQPISTSDTFNVFFARSTDKGNTFPTVLQVSTNSSVLCFTLANPVQKTPDNTTCGSVQMGVDASSNPDMAWVNQASGSAVADIDFAATNLQGQLTNDFSLAVSPNPATAGPGQTVNFTVNATATGTLPQAITLACSNFLSSPVNSVVQGLTCSSFSLPAVSGGQSSTFSVALPGNVPQGQFKFDVNGTSGGTTHRVRVTVSIGSGNTSPGTVSPTSAIVSASSPTATITVTVNPSSFSGTVNFSCQTDKGAALPSWLTCNFNPQQLNPSQSTTDTLTIKRTGTPTSSMFLSAPSSHILPAYGIPMVWSTAIAALCFMSMAMVAAAHRRFNAAVVMRGLLVMTLTIVLAAGLVSCGGSTSTPSSSGSGGSGGSGGGGGTGGGSTPVNINVVVMAQSGSAAPVSLGTVAVTAQ